MTLLFKCRARPSNETARPLQFVESSSTPFWKTRPGGLDLLRMCCIYSIPEQFPFYQVAHEQASTVPGDKASS